MFPLIDPTVHLNQGSFVLKQRASSENAAIATDAYNFEAVCDVVVIAVDAFSDMILVSTESCVFACWECSAIL